MSPLFTQRVTAAGVVALVLLLIGPAIFLHVDGARSLQQGTNHEPKLSSRTDLVQLPVSVTDAHDNFVAGLTIDNFRVLEEGQAQNISFFEEEDTPVTVGLIVDHSGSMGSKLREVAAAVLAFAHSSNAEDEMFVVDFDDTVTVELLHGKPFTSDPQELSEAVTAISARGQTALYDAVAEGFVHLQLGQWNKRALIIVSDGGDNISQHTFAQVLALARTSHAVIYAIGLLSESGQEENPGVLRRLCHDTGGIAFFPPQGASIQAVSTQIARDLRGQYMLGYVPPTKSDVGAFRKIEVKVSAPGRGALHVRSRAGYSVASRLPSESVGSTP
ncbi:MAG TPA: VWA domain-containing protein [Terriglobales bacterium]|jgi:Ca-activated chloride channel homolog|nr:VWA domain-containing protein [Terriglobales bacterium]